MFRVPTLNRTISYQGKYYRAQYNKEDSVYDFEAIWHDSTWLSTKGRVDCNQAKVICHGYRKRPPLS